MSMPEVFDPYRKWLGIPPAEQPPNHYRLLGVGLFEDDADTIAGAADRQMGHVRTFQIGQHSALSQKLLNELSAARLCLLDAEKKAEYDRQLRAKLSAAAGQGRGAPAAPVPIPIPLGQGRAPMVVAAPLQPSAAPQVADLPDIGAGLSADARLRRGSRGSRQPALLVGVAGAALVFLGGIYFLRPKAEVASVRPAGVEAKPDGRVVRTSPSNKVAHTSEQQDGAAPTMPAPVDESAAPLAAEQPVALEDRAVAPAAPVTPMPEERRSLADLAAAKRPQPVQKHRNAAPGVMAAEPPAAPDAPMSEKRRSLADLAAAPRPQLAQRHRDAPPEGKELRVAEGRFQQLFQKEIARAKSPDAVRKLSRKLFNQASEGARDAEVRYVMLGKIGESAVAQGRVGQAYRAAAEIARQFEVDPLPLKLKALEAAARNAQTPAANAVGALQALALADRAARQGTVDLANKAVGQAGAFARKTKDKNLIEQTDRRKAGLRELSKRHLAYKKALVDLKKAPDDAQANLAAGKYEALVLGDWPASLAKLAAAGQAELAEIAYLEAEARLDGAKWAPLSEAWLRAARQEDDFWKPKFERQAKYCWLRAQKQGRAGGLPGEVVEQIKNVPGYPLSRLTPGAAARFYGGADFQRQRAERADALIDFCYGEGSPDPAVPTNFFSARWTGFFKPPIAGRYRIVTFTNDSVRLWVDGQPALNRWGGNAQWQQVELELSDEPHAFRLEYNETFEVAIVRFGWSLAGFPDDARLQWSPIDALYYDPDSPFDLPDMP